MYGARELWRRATGVLPVRGMELGRRAVRVQDVEVWTSGALEARCRRVASKRYGASEL